MPFKPHPTDPTKVIYKTSEYWIPKPWQGLTNEEMVEIREAHEPHIFQIMFAVESKLRSKNEHSC